MKEPRHPSRRLARELAVQLMYQADCTGEAYESLVRHLDAAAKHGGAEEGFPVYRAYREAPAEERRFTKALLEGGCRHQAEVDAKISACSHRWPLRRMMPVVRAILRVSAFELLHTDTPPAVCIDEAVELAKRYGASGSGEFVNGILDALRKGAVPRLAALPLPTSSSSARGPAAAAP